MAKGFNKSGLDILVWEVFRGTGRQFGRDLSKEITKGVKSKVLNNDSKYRKYIDKFTLTGTCKGSIAKVYQLIDQFQHEYTTTKAIFQVSMYRDDDIIFINEKLKMVKRMCFTSAEFMAYENLVETWKEVHLEVLNHG